MELQQRQEMYQGFSDTLARAIELVVTPLIFGVGGHFLDNWLGTGPVLTVVLGAWALVGMVIIAYFGYEAQMRAEEEKLLGPKPGRQA